jgi:glycosyltransferase involved in cell wall biosynthesis
MNSYKIAIVQDELIRRAGGERVGLCIHYAFMDAPVYTTAYIRDDTFPEFKECDVRTSWFNKLVKNEADLKKLFFPFGIMAMKQLDLTAYDIVIQSGTHCSKYVKVNKNALVLTYCYTPFRLAWNPTSYSEYLESKGLKRFVFNVVVNILKKIDKKAAARTDYFIGMTKETSERIELAYHPKNPVTIIPPPVTTANFYVSEEQEDYYFLLSRLEFYKKVDLVIEAFNRTGKRLIIVGRGSKEQELKIMAKSNIEFYSGLPTEQIAAFYSKCKAFLMPQHEDYGITPLEANASGRPVIAYAKGGVLETMIPYNGDAKKCTAVFFEEQTVESLIAAIEKFETLEFDPHFIRAHCEKFDDSNFIEKIKNFTLSVYPKAKSS